MNKQKTQSGKRTYPLKMPKNWQPPYPSFESKFADTDVNIAMMVVGCQFHTDVNKIAYDFIDGLSYIMRQYGKCDHVDLSYCEKDSAGCHQYVATGYWLDSDQFCSFSENNGKFKAYWSKHSAQDFPCGIFREIFNVPMERFETLHSRPDHLVGAANAREKVSDPIQTHGYWGSMRDRIPNSSKELFEGDASIEVLSKDDNRIVVKPNFNVAIIRSGQDLRNAMGKERNEYFSDVQPALISGMNFLRDEGRSVNCFDCRFMSLVDENGKQTDHTYGLAYFASLSDLEDWAEHHPTHLRIFNAFLEYAPKFGAEMKSRYWHEVSVLPENGQYAEYINCQPGTGFLGGVPIGKKE